MVVIANALLVVLYAGLLWFAVQRKWIRSKVLLDGGLGTSLRQGTRGQSFAAVIKAMPSLAGNQNTDSGQPAAIAAAAAAAADEEQDRTPTSQPRRTTSPDPRLLLFGRPRCASILAVAPRRSSSIKGYRQFVGPRASPALAVAHALVAKAAASPVRLRLPGVDDSTHARSRFSTETAVQPHSDPRSSHDPRYSTSMPGWLGFRAWQPRLPPKGPSPLSGPSPARSPSHPSGDKRPNHHNHQPPAELATEPSDLEVIRLSPPLAAAVAVGDATTAATAATAAAVGGAPTAAATVVPLAFQQQQQQQQQQTPDPLLPRSPAPTTATYRSGPPPPPSSASLLPPSPPRPSNPGLETIRLSPPNGAMGATPGLIRPSLAPNAPSSPPRASIPGGTFGGTVPDGIIGGTATATLVQRFSPVRGGTEDGSTRDDDATGWKRA